MNREKRRRWRREKIASRHMFGCVVTVEFFRPICQC